MISKSSTDLDQFAPSTIAPSSAHHHHEGQDDGHFDRGGINFRIAPKTLSTSVEAPCRGATRPGRAADGAPQDRLQPSEERHHEGLGGGQGGDGDIPLYRAPLHQLACGLAAHYRTRRGGFGAHGLAPVRPGVAEIRGCGPPASPTRTLRLKTR